MTSNKSPLVGFNTAGAVRMSSDTALPGRAVRGLRLTQELAKHLPEREVPESKIADFFPPRPDDERREEFPLGAKELTISGMDFVNNGINTDAQGFIQELVDATSEGEKAWIKNHTDLSTTFNGPNRSVHALVGRYLEDPEQLSPAERLTAQRALEISERLKKEDSNLGDQG